MGGYRITLERVLHTKQVTSTGCWIPTQKPLASGYVLFTFDQKKIYAHRWMYQQMIGSIPGGMQIDHLCRNRPCINPEHLEVVDNFENMMRGNNFAAKQARQTHCKNGHEFTPENTGLSRDGERSCLTCRRKYAHDYHQNRKLQIQMRLNS